MRRNALIPILLLVLAFAACENGERAAQTDAAPERPASGAGKSPTTLRGTVSSTVDAGGYTYVEIDTGNEKLWAAGPVTELGVGEAIQVQTDMLMVNFRSEALDRIFDEIYFTSSFGRSARTGDDPHAGVLPEGHPLPAAGSEPDVAPGSVAKAENGVTIAELWAQKESLGGREVVLRDQVTKYLPSILGRNWLHLKDGSATGDAGMIVVTSQQSAAVGDVVLVRGKLTRNKDFGAGYRYDVIVEDATLAPE